MKLMETLSLSLSIYIYIYIYRERERERKREIEGGILAMVDIVIRSGPVSLVQNLYEAVWKSYEFNYFFSGCRKSEGRLSSLILIWQQALEKKTLNLRQVNLTLCQILLVLRDWHMFC